MAAAVTVCRGCGRQVVTEILCYLCYLCDHRRHPNEPTDALIECALCWPEDSDADDFDPYEPDDIDHHRPIVDVHVGGDLL